MHSANAAAADTDPVAAAARLQHLLSKVGHRAYGREQEIGSQLIAEAVAASPLAWHMATISSSSSSSMSLVYGRVEAMECIRQHCWLELQTAARQVLAEI